ncbi:MAG: efflux RND transporter permease subunit [Candidatus Eremiobacteraeota bacterium]|nr:efflux RND transporter permease subunit [Candidatus Eremiobacteraeota bacterium]MCW5866118.1 efflux RND transporter permease subunit [Candidatus Eremiobacteraeota bacterium]
MWLTRLAIRNPIAVLMVSLAVAVLAVLSVSRLPIDMFPALNIPCIQINTNYSGASPEEVERSITYPLEQAVSRVAGIVRVQSTSSVGKSQIQVWFNWGVSLDSSLVQVISNVQRSMGSLPLGIDPPAISQFDVSNFPVVQIAVDAPTLSPQETSQLAEYVISPQLERISGVSDVEVRGAIIRQINVNVDPQKLQARGISLQDVQQALRQNNQLVPSGVLRNNRLDYQLEVPTLLESVEDISQVVVTTRNGVPIKVRDVARVEDGSAPRTEIYRVNGQDTVSLWVLMQPQANLVALSDDVQRTLPRIAGLPDGVELKVIFDQSNYIRTAVRGLEHEGLTGALLVAFVVLVFLRNWTSVVIICVGIPLAVAAALVCLYFGGQTLNIFTLGGLTLALGRLVDDAIVVRENITRHLEEEDLSVSEAVLRATGEVGMPVLASTLTTVAVFFPVVFLEGVSQKLFVPLSLTIIFSMMASYVVSMTIDPVLSIAWTRRSSGPPGRISRWLESVLVWMEDTYERFLRQVLRRGWVVVLVLVLSLGSALMLSPRVKTEFFPESDEGVITVNVQAQLGTGVPTTAELCRRVDQIVTEVVRPDEILAVLTSAGNPTSNQARMFLRLRPAFERKRGVPQISAALRKALADKIPGVRLSVNPGGLARRILNFGAAAPIDVQILGYDQDIGARLASEIERKLRSVPGATDITVVPQGQVPSFHVKIDRERSALLGLNPTQVANTLNTALSGGVTGANRFVEPKSGNEFDLVTQLEENYRTHPEDLGAVPVAALFSGVVGRGSQATPLALRNVATITLGSAPLQIQRKNQVRVIDVTANNSLPLGEVSDNVTKMLKQVEMPEGFTWYLAGQTEQQAGAFASMMLTAGLALMLIYMIMASQFGTLWEPLVIMLTVPLGLVGVCWAQLLTGTAFSVMSFMGVIMMTGIVVSNGILLVEFSKTLQERGLEPLAAVVMAGRTRLRPIVMTALATIVGMIPMATGWGGGSDTNQPLARAVIGGLTVSTVLTLLVIPLFYLWIGRLVARKERVSVAEKEAGRTSGGS